MVESNSEYVLLLYEFCKFNQRKPHILFTGVLMKIMTLPLNYRKDLDKDKVKIWGSLVLGQRGARRFTG